MSLKRKISDGEALQKIQKILNDPDIDYDAPDLHELIAIEVMHTGRGVTCYKHLEDKILEEEDDGTS